MKPDLTTIPALPRDEEGPVFRAPWEAQAFGMTLALYERGAFTWKEWADRLSVEIAAARDRDDGSRYYELWLAARHTLTVIGAQRATSRLGRTRRSSTECVGVNGPASAERRLGAVESWYQSDTMTSTGAAAHSWRTSTRGGTSIWL